MSHGLDEPIPGATSIADGLALGKLASIISVKPCFASTVTQAGSRRTSRTER